MADLKDELVPEKPVDNWDDVPDQRQARLPALPAGPYEFQLPANLSPKHWEPVEYKAKDKDGKEYVEATWHRVRFSADLPLIVVRDATADQTLVGQLFDGSISTAPKKRFVGKKGDPPKLVSDATYLYKDALKGTDRTFKPTESEKLVAAICKIVSDRVQGGGKATFQATCVWNVSCSKTKIRRVVDSNNQNIEDPEKKMGCGRFHKACAAESFTCECGANLRVFPELEGYRASE